MLTIRIMTAENTEEIKELFRDVFMNEPWNDDWSDETQLQQYILDLTGNANSLTIGLFDNDELIGVSIGNIRHWYTGTEYFIDEFFISRSRQRMGYGKTFLKQIEEHIARKGIRSIFLQTGRSMPAYDFYIKNGFTELSEHVSLVKAITDKKEYKKI